jgi:hypothetical protein
MAIKQIVPIEITLIGDGSSTVFTFPLMNMYQNGGGDVIPVGGVGVVPSSIAVSNTPVAVTSSTIDSYGNITITLTSSLGDGTQATMEIDLYYTSGAISSTCTTPAQLITGTKSSNTAAPSSTNIGTLPALASATPTVATQGYQTSLTTDLLGNLKTSQTQTDMFGSPIFQSRDVQWQVNFSLGADATNITPTATGSGTISYTAVPGAVQINTTAAASSGYNLLSVGTFDYQVGFEWFSYFTVAFPSVTGSVGSQVGVANSYQRIGLYNNSSGTPSDGFFVGFEGASSFGISHFRAGRGQDSFSANSAVGIAISSFNGDKCSGSSSSFTSGGSPVAIDFTKINLFRLRGGWLGVGDVVLEVCSPDETWVVMHTFRNPNTLTQPYTSTTTWNYQADIQNTSSTTAISMFMGGGSFGSSGDETRITDAITPTWVVPTVRSVEHAQYLSSGYVTPTSGNYGPLQINSSGALNVNIASSSLTDPAETTGGTTAPSKVLVVGGKTTDSTAQYQPLPLTNSGVALIVGGQIQTGNAPTAVSVGITSATALSANTSRTSVILINTSANVISLGFGSNAAVLYSGVTLYSGGSVVLDVMDNVQQAITAIASVASSNLAIQEFN